MKTDLNRMRQQLTNLLLFTVLLSYSPFVGAQCLNPELALINACIEHPNPNGGPLAVESEILVVSSGVIPVPVNTIRVDVPFNGLGPENADISQTDAGDCRFKEPTVTSLPGCPNAIPLGPNDVIPPNAFIVIFTNGITVTADVVDTDFSNLCPLGSTIYILQNACERSSGAFANESSGGDPLRTIGIFSGCGLRIFTYNTTQISPEDGTYYLVGTNTSGNLDCDLPEIPETCPSIDTSYFICDLNGTMDPVPALEFERAYPITEVAVSFHESPAGAETNTDQVTVYTPTGVATDTIWARIIYSDNFCVVVSPLVIRYQNMAAVTTAPANPLPGCDPNFQGLGLFNLRLLDVEIGGQQPVTYYTDAAGTNEIIDPTEFSSVPVIIFAVAGFGSCRGAVVPVELELDNSPFLDPVATETSCPGNDDGTITVNATGAGPFTYAWAGDTLPSDAVLTGLPAGTYNVTVTNANGCAVDRDITVIEGLPPRVNCSLQSGTSGPGAMNAVVRLEIAEGRRPYDITWVGAAAGAISVNGAVAIIPGLGAGSYDFTVTDADGCVSSACRVEVSEVVPINLQCIVRNNSDGGTILGAIITTIEDGVAPFLVQLTNNDTGMTTDFPNRPNGEILFDNLPAGQYTVTVTGADGAVERCVLSIVVTPCPLTITEISQFPVDCEGSDLVIVSIVGAGANGDLTTTWMGPNNVEIFNGQQDAGPLPPGTYFVNISDESGCSVDPGPIIVVDPGPPLYEVNTNGTSSICDPNGTIDVILNGGGNAPYIIHLVDATNDMEIATFDNRQQGDVEAFFNLPGAATGPNYYVYVTDQIGCSGDTSFVSVISSAAAALTLDPLDQQLNPPACAGDSTGTITLSASGGAGPYNYRWLEHPQQANGRVLADGDGQIDLPAGNYVVEISDAGSCIDTFTLVLDDGIRPILTCGPTTDAVGMNNGAVLVDFVIGTAPYELTLTRMGVDTVIPNLAVGNHQITNLPPGDYTGVVRDQNGCTSLPCSFTIGLQPCALSSSAVIDSIDCTGNGRIEVTVNGATTPPSFSWAEATFPAAAVVEPATPGNYPVTITDGNGCQLDTSFTIFARDDAPTVDLSAASTQRICLGETALIPLTFTGTGPFTLRFATDRFLTPPLREEIFTNQTDTLRLSRADLPADSNDLVFLTVMDARCTGNIPANVFQIVFNRPDTVRRNDVTCDPNPVMIGGRSFDATNPSDTFLLTGGAGCGTLFEVDLTFLDENAEVPDTLEVFICPGTDYTEPTTGEVFNAARPEGELRYPRPGRCDSVVYLRLDLPEVSIGSFSQGGFCEGDTLFYGDRFFTFENPSGLATLTGMAANGCDSLVTVTGSFRRVGGLRLFGDFNICPGDSIELRFTYDGPGSIDAVLEDTQGNRYNLPGLRDNDRHQLFPAESTAYRIVSTIAGPCPGEFAGGSTVTVNDLGLAAEVLLDPVDICRDTLGTVVANPSGGTAPYTFNWSNGPTDSLNRNLLGGTYAVTVEDADGCVRIDSVMISDRNGLRVNLSANPPPCEGGFGTLEVDSIQGGSGFYEVSIDGTFFLPVDRIGDFNIPPGTAGTATFQDAEDCSVEVNFFVPFTFDPDIRLLEDTLIVLGDSVFLDPTFNLDLALDTAFWEPALGLRNPGQLATIAAPLSSTDYQLTLRTVDGCEFLRFVSVQVDERLPVYAPNVFSPNGDEVNDTFELQFGAGVRNLRSFQIFNRWGNLMHDRLEGWDGVYNGQPALPAVYVFQAIIEMADGTERFVKGDFVLMR